MNIDYETLEFDIESGALREQLKDELVAGFRQIKDSGERLPTASHYAAQIAEIVNRGASLSDVMKFELYQEILEACEAARATVLSEAPQPS